MIKLHNSNIPIKECHQVRCSHHRTYPTQLKAKILRFRMHTRSKQRPSSLSKLEGSHHIHSISTLYWIRQQSKDKAQIRTAKVAEDTAIVSTRAMEPQEKLLPNLLTEAIHSSTAPWLATILISHLLHSIHKLSPSKV